MPLIEPITRKTKSWEVGNRADLYSPFPNAPGSAGSPEWAIIGFEKREFHSGQANDSLANCRAAAARGPRRRVAAAA